MRNAFLDELFQIAQDDSRVTFVTGDLGYSVAEKFADNLPRQFLNAGVAEANMTTLATGMALGLSPGGVALMMVLAGSASYIAVPAAMRVALPDANPSVYLTLSLGVTFPFNLTIGIPAWVAVAKALGV